MGKEDTGRSLPVPGLVLADPEDFRRRVTGQHRVSGEFHHLGLATEHLGEFGALGGRRGVAPELGGADHLIGVIQKDEAVLLTAHADPGDFAPSASQLLQNLRNRGLHGGDPDGGILLHGTISLGFHKSVSLLGAGQNLPRGDVEGDCLGALRSAVDTEGDHGGKDEGRMKNEKA